MLALARAGRIKAKRLDGRLYFLSTSLQQFLAGLDDGCELSEEEEAAALAALSSTSLTVEELDRLAERFPAPQSWYDEPGWDDAD